MRPDTSRWREPASYAYFDELSVEGLAWECLRRDTSYQEHYHALVKAGTDAEPLPREVEQRVGLRFRRPARAVRPGAGRPVVARRRPSCPAFHSTGGIPPRRVLSIPRRSYVVARQR
jgi:hypothetical protein